MKRASTLALPLTLVSLFACSGADDEVVGPDDRAVQPTEAPAVDDPSLSQPGALMAAPPASDGFQVALEPFEVMPGEEAYYCYRLPMPVDEDFDLGAVEARFSVGAHHLLLSTVDRAYEPGQGPCAASDFGYEVPLNEAMSSNLRFLSGAQTPYSSDPKTRLELEEGVAFQLRSDTTLLVQIHWANTTSEVQQATTTVNFEYAKSPTVMPLESFFFYHTDIALPPHTSSEVAGRCSLPEGHRIVSMVSHMHARGTDFTVHRSRDSEVPVYREQSWSEPQMHFFSSDELLELEAGETLDYRCFFDNDTPNWIYDGDGAGEEMCMLIGLYTGGTGTIWGFPGIPFEGNACTAIE